MNARRPILRSCLGIACVLLIGMSANAQSSRPAASQPTTAASSEHHVTDRPVAPYILELLDLAHDSATAIPVEPHIKDRSSLQQKCVETALDLDQPSRARTYIDDMLNWRRGNAYALVAMYYAERGDMRYVDNWLERAKRIATVEEDWRRDRIRVNVARVLAVQGDLGQAEELQEDVVDAEVGRVNTVLARDAKAEDFDAIVISLREVLQLQQMDLSVNALETCVELYDRFFDDEEKRKALVKLVVDNWGKTPIDIRIDVLLDMADRAADHDRNTVAIALIDDAQKLVDQFNWSPDFHIDLLGRFAKARAAAGDSETARAEVTTAQRIYDDAEERIPMVFRAESLRFIAEAASVAGDRDRTLDLYRNAVDVPAGNPNGRPRAEDLSRTCLSMARYGVEPDEEFWTTLRDIRAGLRKPW